MKRYATLLAIVAAMHVGWIAPANAQKGFDVQHLGLINCQRKGKAKLDLGHSSKAAIRALGKPTQKGKMYFEMDADTALVLYYRTNRLYFLKDALVGFELNDNTLAYGKSPEQAFRVGSALTTEVKLSRNVKQINAGGPAVTTRYLVDKTTLRGLKLENKPGKSRNINYKIIAHNHTRYGDEKYDGWFEMLFDAKNKVINIAMGE